MAQKARDIRTAPHIDAEETRARAVRLLLDCLREGIRPHTAFVPIPALFSGEQTMTMVEPGQRVLAMLRQPRSDAREQAAVHAIATTSAERGVVAGQEQYQLSHFFWPPNPPERMRPAPIAYRLRRVVSREHLRRHLQHWRLDRAWRDAVAANILGGVVERDRHRKAYHRTLCRRVGRHHLLRCKRLDRGSVDDRAPTALAHLRNGVLAGQKRAFEIDTYHPVPIFLGHIDNRTIFDHTRIVVQHIHTAERS